MSYAITDTIEGTRAEEAAGEIFLKQQSNALKRFVALSLVSYAVLFIYVAVRQALYPGFTEPMEGDILRHIERAARGMTLYPMPGEEYIALAHMPLYYYLSAPFYYIFGDSFTGPRLVSLICSIGASFLVVKIAMKESTSPVIAMIAGSLFFSSYRIMDAYLTCALPDALLLFLLLSGYYFFAYGTKLYQGVFSLIFFSLAFWTKQHGALYFGFMALYALLFPRNYLPRWVVLAGIILGGPVAYYLLGAHFGDGFFYHTFVVPGNWEHKLWFSIRRGGFIIFYYVPFCALLTFIYLKSVFSKDGFRVSPLVWFLIAALASSSFTMTAAGSSNNHYIPFIAVLTITSALGVQTILGSETYPELSGWLILIACVTTAMKFVSARFFRGHDVSALVPLAAVFVAGLYLFLKYRNINIVKKNVLISIVLLLGQFAVSFYYPPEYLPPSGFKAAVSNLRQQLASLDGPVMWYAYGNVPEKLTGFRIMQGPSWVALSDIERQKGHERDARIRLAAFRKRVRETKNLYILSNTAMKAIDLWGINKGHLRLVKDFGKEFGAIKQISRHWFGGGGYPRFLYLKMN